MTEGVRSVAFVVVTYQVPVNVFMHPFGVYLRCRCHCLFVVRLLLDDAITALALQSSKLQVLQQVCRLLCYSCDTRRVRTNGGDTISSITKKHE